MLLVALLASNQAERVRVPYIAYASKVLQDARPFRKVVVRVRVSVEAYKQWQLNWFKHSVEARGKWVRFPPAALREALRDSLRIVVHTFLSLSILVLLYRLQAFQISLNPYLSDDETATQIGFDYIRIYCTFLRGDLQGAA